MKIDHEQYSIYKIRNTPILTYPYPHMFTESVFHESLYPRILENLPDNDDYTSLSDTSRTVLVNRKGEKKGAYDDRHILKLEPEMLSLLPDSKQDFWYRFAEWFMGRDFVDALLQKFDPYIKHRLAQDPSVKEVVASCLITRDKTGYSIGPHTDSPRKLLTFLFYLPKNDDLKQFGTSIYLPHKSNFKCEGGPHYPFDGFKRVYQAPFLANSMFCFYKTNDSFHGVELIEEENIERDLLIYNIDIVNK